MDISCLQDFLNQIDGIESCKVIGDDNNNILEIHILSDASRSPKQIARDIETAILTKFNKRIDRKVVSIVEFKGSHNKLISRIKLNGVSISSLDNITEIQVKLLYEDKEYFSKLSGVNTLYNKNRMVAESTLKAIEEIMGQPYIMCASSVIVNELPNYSVVTVLVTLKQNYFEDLLVGSAVVKGDTNETIARATLDAVNRKINSMTL